MTCFIRCVALVCSFSATSLIGCGESSFSTANGGGMANHGGARSLGTTRTFGAKGGRSAVTEPPPPTYAGAGTEPVTCDAIPVCNEGDTDVTGSCPEAAGCYPVTLCGNTIECLPAPAG